jgi:DNA circularisation protein N-terminus
MPDPVTPILGDVELRTIQRIATVEQRTLVEHNVPGMAGSAFQDLGRAATRVQINGVLFGADARSDLEKLRTKFKAAEAVSFAADITTATEIVDVLIEDLQVVEAAGRPNTFNYMLLLRESPPPPPPPDPLAGLNTGILGDAQGLFDQAVGVMDALNRLGSVPDFGDPTVPLGNIVDSVGSITGVLPAVLGPLGELFSQGT